MFPARYFPAGFFPARYFPKGSGAAVVASVGAVLGKPKRKRKFIKSIPEPEPLAAVAANDDQPQITLPDSEQEDEDFIIQWLLSRAA